MRFRGTQNFFPVQCGEEYNQIIKCEVHFRSEKPCYVYQWNDEKGIEVLAGYGQNPFQVLMELGTFRVESEGRVWMSSEVAQQSSYLTSEEKFTTLDRPNPLSPEMQAVQRMVRMNELARERDRAEMEARLNDIRRTYEGNQEVMEGIPEDSDVLEEPDVSTSDEADGGHEDEPVEEKTTVPRKRAKKGAGSRTTSGSDRKERTLEGGKDSEET
jgi:hypothetical protein